MSRRHVRVIFHRGQDLVIHSLNARESARVHRFERDGGQLRRILQAIQFGIGELFETKLDGYGVIRRRHQTLFA